MRDAGRRAWFLEGRANWADGHQKRVIRAEHGARAVSPWKCCSLARTSMGRRCRRGHPRKYHRIKTPIIRRRIRILVLRRPNGRIFFRVVGSDGSYIMGSREISGLRSSLADRARAALPKRDIPIRRGTLGIPNRGSGGVHPAGPPRTASARNGRGNWREGYLDGGYRGFRGGACALWVSSAGGVSRPISTLCIDSARIGCVAARVAYADVARLFLLRNVTEFERTDYPRRNTGIIPRALLLTYRRKSRRVGSIDAPPIFNAPAIAMRGIGR